MSILTKFAVHRIKEKITQIANRTNNLKLEGKRNLDPILSIWEARYQRKEHKKLTLDREHRKSLC